MTLSHGTRLGAYEVLTLIGSGGFGEVYKARDTRLDRTVAIKVLPSGDPELKARFEREAKAIAALQHSHICTLHDVGHQGGTDYLVMEYLEGRTLRTVLSDGRLPAKVTIRYAIQLCQGLAAAHDRGIVHRDLKPENVFVTKAGQLKILDFGLAKAHKSRPSLDSTTGDTGPGVVMGTVAYMSPEQIKGDPVDSRSDVFSLGIILYEMVAGRHPFRGEDYVETMQAILRSTPAPLSRTDDPVAPVLSSIIERCLEKDRDRRFQSARGIFAIRGAQLVLAAPTPMGGEKTTGDAEAIEETVTYREPPNWLVWSGPIFFALIALAFVASVLLSTPASYVSGCVKSSNGRTAILLISEPSWYRGAFRTLTGYDLLEGYDFRTEVGHQVEVRYTDFWGRSPRTGNLFIRNIRRLADTCSEVESQEAAIQQSVLGVASPFAFIRGAVLPVIALIAAFGLMVAYRAYLRHPARQPTLLNKPRDDQRKR